MPNPAISSASEAIEFVAWSSQLCQCNGGVTGEIQSQFKRAFISIPLNIAEGSCKQTGKAFLVEIVAMLTALAKSVAGERVREQSQVYLPHQKT